MSWGWIGQFGHFALLLLVKSSFAALAQGDFADLFFKWFKWVGFGNPCCLFLHLFDRHWLLLWNLIRAFVNTNSHHLRVDRLEVLFTHLWDNHLSWRVRHIYRISSICPLIQDGQLDLQIPSDSVSLPEKWKSQRMFPPDFPLPVSSHRNSLQHFRLDLRLISTVVIASIYHYSQQGLFAILEREGDGRALFQIDEPVAHPKGWGVVLVIMMQDRESKAVARRGLEELSMDEFELNKERVGLVHISIQNESVKNNHNAWSNPIIKILRIPLAILDCPTNARLRIKIMRNI